MAILHRDITNQIRGRSIVALRDWRCSENAGVEDFESFEDAEMRGPEYDVQGDVCSMYWMQALGKGYTARLHSEHFTSISMMRGSSKQS